MMVLKYERYLKEVRDNFQIICPAAHPNPKYPFLAYRWVSSELSGDDFVPIAILEEQRNKPKRTFPPNNRQHECNYYGLSLYIEESYAKNAWNSMSNKNKTTLGYTHIAECSLSEDDGILSEEKNGHINLHEYTKINQPELKSKFKISREL